MTEQPDNPPDAADKNATDAPAVTAAQRSGLRQLPARLLRGVWRCCVILLVTVAIYMTAGRLLMPYVAGQIVGVETRLSRLLGATVTLDDLQGTWFRFSPGLEVQGLRIATGSGDAADAHAIGRVFVALDVFESLLRRQLVLATITIDDLQLTLQETENGRWGLAGLPLSDGPDYSRQIVDFILEIEDLALTEAALRIRRADGTETTVASLYLELQNRGSQHELHTQFRINGQESPSQVLIDMAGDPYAAYTASAYANVTGLDLAPLLAAVPTGSNWELQRSQISSRLWLDLDQNGVQQLRAAVSDLQLQAASANGVQVVDVENAAFNLAARPVTDAAGNAPVWNLQLTDLAFDWQQTPWEVPTLYLELPMAETATLSVQASTLELGMLKQIVTTALPLPDRAIASLDTLDPSGLLRNIHFATARDGSYPGGFLLRANLEDGAVEAWSGAPSGDGLNGYLQAEAGKGFVEVDSRDLNLHLPRLFEQSWHYDRLNTRVQWQLGNGELRISSSAIDVQNSGLQGQVQFELYNSRNARDEPVSELSVLVGMQSMDVSMGAAYLPSLSRLRGTVDWLKLALQEGQLHDSGFVLRTSTRRDAPPGSNTFATWYQVTGGRLQFLPDWPALEGIQASVSVRDGEVEVNTEAASIAGIDLSPATATVQRQADGGALLAVRGAASAGTDAGLEFLRGTPVRKAIGPLVDNWRASGNVAVDIALDIPLNAGADKPLIAVEVLSTASELNIPDYALVFSDINGRINYHSDTGISAEALDARLFDFPIVAGIQTINDPLAGRSTRITSSGRASVTALQLWPRQPDFVRGLLGYMRGDIDYTAQLSILNQNGADGIRTQLDLHSDLLGVRSSLPQPFDKSIDEAADLELRLGFMENGQVVTARYGDFLSGELVFGPAGIDRGQLYFGDRNRNFNVRQSDANMPGLLISGDLPYFNYEEWRVVTDALSAVATANNSGAQPSQSLADYLRLVDVNLGTLAVLGQELQDINVQVEYDGGWQIQGLNTLLSGSLMLPEDTAQPWLVNLDYLRFPPREEPAAGDAAEGETAAENAAGESTAENAEAEEEEKVDMLAAVNPAALPALDFSTGELSIGEQNLGAFSFQLRPNSNGATIADFRMRALDASISDIAQTGGANVDWRYRNGMHTSSFNGLFEAGDLATVLPAWGHDANVESESARFSGTLQWQGSPLAFSLEDTSGQVLMDINTGRFVNIESSSSRLLGALNFDALVRRLQLDFSDLFQRGFAFDRISGNLNFNEGVVTTNGGIIIEGPSSRISINGEIDLAAETIAADMQVRIPLGQNISMVAGILGAWPLALSTYLASKIFQDQVADFTTVIYRLDGPWENPAAGFEAPQ